MQRLFTATSIGIAAAFPSPRAVGQTYTGTVLYQLNAQSGFNSTGCNGVAGPGTVGYGSGTVTGGNTQAMLWTASLGSQVDLNPSGFSMSDACGISATQEVGYGNIGGVYHALLWTGTAASATDLNPSGILGSYALGTSGTQQVGSGTGTATGGNSHALLWTGTAASAVDLNPSGYYFSEALATNGSQQVGEANNDAMLWTGTAASAVNLNPSGYSSSFAAGTSGTQQVGQGAGSATGNHPHAMLWSGTAASAVDLNPSGFTASCAKNTNGTQQVGYGSGSSTGGWQHALLWTGTAGSVLDLNTLLPTSDTWLCSDALSVDASGDVFGCASDASNSFFAVEWTAVPEPATVGLLVMGAAGLLVRRNRVRG